MLQQPDSIELLSVDPGYFLEPPPPGTELFRGFKVLGRTSLSSADGEAVLRDVFAGIDDHNGVMAACFNPRHAVAAIKDDVRVDFLICFECSQIQVYGPGMERPESSLDYRVFGTSGAANDALDSILRSAGATLAPSALH